MIRFLEPADAEPFVALRRMSLQDVPLAFASSPDDDRMSDLETARHLLAEGGDTAVVGAFRDNDLIGIAGLYRDRHVKCAHKVHVWGMYVVAGSRGQGLGERLLRALLLHARSMEGVRSVDLGVSDAASDARRLYGHAGFVAWGTERDALRIDGVATDVTCMALTLEPAAVVAVSRGSEHGLRKGAVDAIRLLPGLGVEGDAHLGESVQHRSRVAKFPDMPNLRQVHLIHAELHDELRDHGFSVAAGKMGENVTTRGLDVLGLPVGTRLTLGRQAVVEITGLRNPCKQLDAIAPGLMAATLGQGRDGRVVRKAGVMAVVVDGGDVGAGDTIRVELPRGSLRSLQPV